MADSKVDIDPPPIPTTADFNSGLSIPPLDDTFFTQHLFNGNDSGNNQDVLLEDIDFDFSFDDLCLPSSDLDELLSDSFHNSTQFENSNLVDGVNDQQDPDSCLMPFATGSGLNLDQFHDVFKSACPELRHLPGDGDQTSNGSGVLNSTSPGVESNQISGYLCVPSPESNGSNRRSSETCGVDATRMNCPSPESLGSGNCGSNLSEGSQNDARSVNSMPNFINSSTRVEVVDQKIKFEGSANNNVNSSVLKRKKVSEDLGNNNVNDSMDSRINKFRKSECNVENDCKSNNITELSEGEEKKKARLIRNRESAQLSRQRKKHYVEELEDKVRANHSTIQELNAKISYLMAENMTLRQQIGGGSNVAVPPPPMATPPPGMYPHPTMMYPWMPYAPPYMVKPQGSQVPLVPIPRLKPAQVSKASKKVENKKNEQHKTKKVAGVSFLGLLFFIMLFGGLVPMVNVRYGGVKEALSGGETYVGGEYYENHRGRVLMVNGTEHCEKYGGRREFNSNSNMHCGQRGGGSRGDPSTDESVHMGNGSEPLVASLYVPRNDKLVKIDGNLIIHSVLASEKAMTSHGEGGGENGLAVRGDFAPAISVPGVGRNGARLPHLRALGSGSEDNGTLKSKGTDGRLQQWFREGLAGPMLSSGMCTEVFHFDVSSASASGAIVPATARNISEEKNKNSTHLSKGRNRRILHGHPIPFSGSSHNISKEYAGRNSQKENLNGNNSVSSMVVSVLMDPREASDADVDGVMGTKSLSRIFVVVLIDSVKYVTYSCMLPLKGAAHLVTT